MQKRFLFVILLTVFTPLQQNGGALRLSWRNFIFRGVTMILSLLLALASFYFAYSAAGYVFAIPFSEWGFPHLVNAFLAVVLLALGIYNVVRAWKGWKKKSAQLNEMVQQQEEKQRAKRRALYFEQDEAEETDGESADSAPVEAGAQAVQPEQEQKDEKTEKEE